MVTRQFLYNKYKKCVVLFRIFRTFYHQNVIICYHHKKKKILKNGFLQDICLFSKQHKWRRLIRRHYKYLQILKVQKYKHICLDFLIFSRGINVLALEEPGFPNFWGLYKSMEAALRAAQRITIFGGTHYYLGTQR